MVLEIDVKKIQNRLLEMAESVADILEKNNIPYSMAFGTLLGAVRHKGFIPWDDDFDFLISDDEYDYAIKLLRESLPNNYFLEDHLSEPLYFHGWAHVKDLKSEAENEQFPQDNFYFHKGISLDLYRMKRMKLKMLNDYIKEEYIKYLNRRKRNGLISEEEFKGRFSLAQCINDYVVKESDNDETEIYAVVSSYNRKYMLVDDVMPLKKYQFEHREFYGPNNADAILKSIYGDYMKMPPINERNSHYSKIVFYD